MSDAVIEHGKSSIEQGSTSFAAASRLFGKTLREDVWRLYAWCRHCDDEIDGQDHGGLSTALTSQERHARLARLRSKTAQAMAGHPMDEPSFAAFSHVALKHRFDPAWPDALLDGFAMDVDGHRFANRADTLGYCWGVAGVVGVMMAAIMGARDEAVLRRAQDLGLAFQLTNICRDVREDALNGRVYLPADALAAVGVASDPATVSDPAHAAAVFRVVTDQLELAEDYYDSARIGLRALPFRGALAVAAARRIYRRIGREILKAGPVALQTRRRVARPVMVGLLLLGGIDALWSRLERLAPGPPRAALWSRL
ncbi:phytoene/squalene synthase family protein [Caulobacter segnis]|uniref:phytoene/squalene synthase family protein n=1 Tax=Caulobacter segnis TaxID=88688 RepID=UPI00240F7079|nr:phytoene/squalene synthase family protein [Caulobacter segnis]MDG2520611.1 phytoene/squalene synthase family protein [Caulobacter segnis]